MFFSDILLFKLWVKLLVEKEGWIKPRDKSKLFIVLQITKV